MELRKPLKSETECASTYCVSVIPEGQHMCVGHAVDYLLDNRNDITSQINHYNHWNSNVKFKAITDIVERYVDRATGKYMFRKKEAVAPPQTLPEPPTMGEVKELKKENAVQRPDIKKLDSGLSEDKRLEIKSRCLVEAVKLISMGDFGSEEFEQLMGEIETVTIKFYNIVVEKNEHKR